MEKSLATGKDNTRMVIKTATCCYRNFLFIVLNLAIPFVPFVIMF